MTEQIGHELVKEHAILRGARTPVPTPQPWVWGVNGTRSQPSGAGGVDCSDAIFAVCGVRLRKSSDRLRSWLRIDSGDSGETYGLYISRLTTQITSAGMDGDVDATAAAYKAALEAEPNFTAPLNLDGTVEYVSGRTDLLEISIKYEEVLRRLRTDLLGSVAGSPYQSAVTEARFVRWRVWGRLKGTKTWGVIEEVEPVVAWRSQESYRSVNVGPYDRVYVEVVDTDGLCLPICAPCAVDGQRDTGASSALFTQRDTQDRYEFPTDEVGHNLHWDGEVVQGNRTISKTDTLVVYANPFRRRLTIRNIGDDLIHVTRKSVHQSSGHISHQPLYTKEVIIEEGENVSREWITAKIDPDAPGSSQSLYYEEA